MRALLICLLAWVSVLGGESLRLDYEGGAWLVIRGEGLPEAGVRVHYLEAYCRAGSTEADWVEHTVIPHRTEVLSGAVGVTELRLRDVLDDGLVVEHVIRSGADEVDFRLRAHNPTGRRSEAHWAQPCVRLGEFMGYAASGGDLEDYLPGCFIFLGGEAVRLSEVRPWATEARYVPGQVWCPAGVPRGDVNPRPLSDLVPGNGLIGAYSGDGERIFATAWEPYQELFQGVIRCLHSDFRLGGVGPGEVREVRGKIYFVKNDMPALLKRYERDFPEQVRGGGEQLDVSIREGSEAGGLNVRSTSFPGELLDFRTCEGVVVGSEDLGLSLVKVPMEWGDGWKSWRREGEVWSYEWPYDRGVVVRVEPGASVEVEGRLYWMEGSVGDVLARFRSDFPECFNGVK